MYHIIIISIEKDYKFSSLASLEMIINGVTHTGIDYTPFVVLRMFCKVKIMGPAVQKLIDHKGIGFDLN